MTREQYDLEFNKMYEEFKKYPYQSEEAKTIWWNFHDKHDLRNEYYNYLNGIAERVLEEKQFKLSKTQREIVKKMITDMIKAKIGREWTNNHYEYTQVDKTTVDWIFGNYYEKGLYLERMNTKTLEKLSSLGIIEIVEVGGKFSDTVKPLFDFELTEQELEFIK